MTTQPAQPMNTPELPQAEVAIMPEEVKVEFEELLEKLRKEYQYLYIGYLLNSIQILLLLLFLLPQ